MIMIVDSAYFSASETGMMTLNRYRLRHLSKQGNRSARRVEKLLQKPDRLIGLVLIGNNLVNILASALATIVGMRLYGDLGVAIALPRPVRAPGGEPSTARTGCRPPRPVRAPGGPAGSACAVRRRSRPARRAAAP
ncbi:CNNM domain-containing protein [Streptomyces sp. NPDC047968]|uniref:CNNM domain-containing protein n=1 Tax=Streptomyces sp. NPDC047968 TaxID=3155382 RepID=UPI0034183C90